MEHECRETVRTVLQKDTDSTKKLGVSGGRIWVACLSCPRVVTMENAWTVRLTEESFVRNAYMITICGACEGNNGRTAIEAISGRVHVFHEMLESSAIYQTIAAHCDSAGSGKLYIAGCSIKDRRALLRDHVGGTKLRSVRMVNGNDGTWNMEMTDFVDAAFMR